LLARFCLFREIICYPRFYRLWSPGSRSVHGWILPRHIGLCCRAYTWAGRCVVCVTQQGRNATNACDIVTWSSFHSQTAVTSFTVGHCPTLSNGNVRRVGFHLQISMRVAARKFHCECRNLQSTCRRSVYKGRRTNDPYPV